MSGKWLELVKEIAPHVTRTAVLRNPAIASYGPSYPGMHRRAAYFVDRILKGTKPAPRAQRIAVLVNAQALTTRNSLTIEARSAAARMDLQIDAIEVRSVQDATDEVERVKARGADALLVIPEPIFNTVPNRIPDLVARLAFPAIYGQREMVQAGGLMSYGADLTAIARRHAHLVDRVLRGAHPSEIPVEQPTRYDFVINLKTARALGLDIPPHSSPAPTT